MLAVACAAALLVALVLRVAERGSDVSWWLNYQFPREGSEGLTIYEALLTRLGENIYALPTATRFISAPYPPLYYYLSGALLDPAAPAFAPGRWLSLFAFIATALIGGLLAVIGVVQSSNRAYAVEQGEQQFAPTESASILWQLRKSYSKFKVQNYLIPFALTVLLFATMYPALIWAARFRADMLALALMAGGLLAMQQRPRGTVAWLAALLLALAFFTKQTALAGPLAAALYLLLLAWQSRRTRQGEQRFASTTVGRGVSFGWAFTWMAGLAALCLLPILLLTLLTGGGYWAKLVTYHALPFSARTLLNLLGGALLDNEWPLLIVAAAFLLLAANDLRHGRTVTIVAPYLLAATLLLPSGGVVGADSNHLLAICFALALAAGQLAARIFAPHPDPLPRRGEGMIVPHPDPLPQGASAYLAPIAALGLAALLTAYLFASAQPSGWYGLDLRRPSDAEQTQLARIVANVRQNPGTNFLSDEVGLLILAAKRPAYDDLFDLTALANLGRWDDSALRQQVQNRQFAIILLHNQVEELRGDILTNAMRDAIINNYRLLFSDIWYTYVPK